VGVERNFGRFYTLFVMNFRENDFWSQPSKNRCTPPQPLPSFPRLYDYS